MDNQSQKTLLAYNEKAKELGLPQAQMIVSCNIRPENIDW